MVRIGGPPFRSDAVSAGAAVMTVGDVGEGDLFKGFESGTGVGFGDSPDGVPDAVFVGEVGGRFMVVAPV